jgi:hypothetical protein
MHVRSRPSGQLYLDLGMLVGTVPQGLPSGLVGNDAVHIEFGRHRLIDFTQERQELLIPMTRLAGGPALHP